MAIARTIDRILHQPPGETTVLRLLPAIASGLAVFVAINGIPVALAFVSHALGMAALAVLTLAALVLAYRAGLLSILAASFAALLSAVLAVGGVEDWRSARRTAVAEIPVTQAPGRGDAPVLIFTDARVATEFMLTWTAPLRPGGPAVHHAVAPLVPSDWQRGMPVPAWRVCSGRDAAWCPQALHRPVRAAQRLKPDDAARVRPVIADMARRFGLEEAPDAPLLQAATPPAERAQAARTGIMVMPVLGFIVWLLGLLLWRALRRLRAGRG